MGVLTTRLEQAHGRLQLSISSSLAANETPTLDTEAKSERCWLCATSVLTRELYIENTNYVCSPLKLFGMHMELPTLARCSTGVSPTISRIPSAALLSALLVATTRSFKQNPNILRMFIEQRNNSSRLTIALKLMYKFGHTHLPSPNLALMPAAGAVSCCRSERLLACCAAHYGLEMARICKRLFECRDFLFLFSFNFLSLAILLLLANTKTQHRD